MQSIHLIFKPLHTDVLKKSGKYDIYAKITYNMFPEMEGEFKRNDERWKPYSLVKLDCDEDENGCWEYEKELEYPWGLIEISYGYDLKNRKIEDIELREIPQNDINDAMVEIFQPKEIKSMQNLREEHSKEEEENKKREQEARLAQKRLEEEKARLRYEQQAQIAKQEQNTA